MAAKDTGGQPRATGRAEGTGKAAERPGNPSGDVGEILDDMDEALEENAEEIVRSFVQEGGQ
jgi:ubiquitin-like protein Pup